MHDLYVCVVCTLYIYALYVVGNHVARDRCMPHVDALFACLICDRKVFRGMSGVKLPECFMRPKEGGGAGGVDFGFVSTTTDRKVATSYLGNKALPGMFSLV